VSEEAALWSTTAGGFYLNPADGEGFDRRRAPAPALRPRPAGNMAFADGVLVVATADELWGYVVERRADAADPARDRAERLADGAERALLAGRPDAARALLRQGLAADLPPPWRAWAAGGWPTLEPPADGPARRLSPRAARQLTAEWVRGPGASRASSATSSPTLPGADPTPTEPAKPPPRSPRPVTTPPAPAGLGPSLASPR
jgi:hypothetical protein